MKLQPMKEDFHSCGLISGHLQMQDFMVQIHSYSCIISSMFNSLQELNKKEKTENTKMQSYLDFLFLVNACVNVYLLTRLYMSILFVFSCAHEPELT